MSGNLRPSKPLPQIQPQPCDSSRRSSVHICSTEASSKHVAAEWPGKTRHSMPALPSGSSPSHLSPSTTDWEHQTQEWSRPQSTDLQFVGLDPPITRAVLRDLDITRLANDLDLRHHLLFNPRAELRVETQGPQAKEKRKRASEYWRAVATEIAMWLTHCQRTAESQSSRPLRISLPRPGAQDFPHGATLRLPRLLGAVRDILKHSLPSVEWPTIDAALDVELLMQQLEHGVCDFTALSDWLGNYLRRFCSPTRDHMLHTMASAIRLGVENAKPDSIVQGLMTIFEVLQGMNLDTANYSIKIMRLTWVENTIAFEQNLFLRSMADGRNIVGARIWFDNLQEADEEPRSGLWTLVRALTEAIVFYEKYFPSTLYLDHSRLHRLQLDFQFLVFQAACRRTLIRTLRSLRWTGKILNGSYASLFSKVAVLISDQGLQYDFWQERHNVALEIVRAAYTVCNRNRELPTPEDQVFAEKSLRRCCDPKERIFGRLQDSLAIELEDKVDDEVSAIEELSPEQLMRRLVPQQPVFRIQSEVQGLLHIAKRIAHIAELHWRIWGPILYERPMARARGPRHLVEEDDESREESSCSDGTGESEESSRDTCLG